MAGSFQVRFSIGLFWRQFRASLLPEALDDLKCVDV
jgi:hypothetical protein